MSSLVARQLYRRFFTLPDVRGSEEIWRTEQCIYQWYLLLHSILLLHYFCIFSLLLLHLKQ